MKKANRGNFGTCAKCHQQILWIKTINGKNMPVNARLITYRVPKEGKGKERIVTPNGETVSAEIVQSGTQDATGVGYISHFAPPFYQFLFIFDFRCFYIQIHQIIYAQYKNRNLAHSRRSKIIIILTDILY